ncbi:phage tail protein [Solihabitans fulvus]|uniref:Phage tail protein n=1 Tax=Solihabitans fulvus TaxID=1892852 RepID=A0A5B2X6C4_9PSEU|nr:phage tail protein [Solihabitans fulvus]KAA2258794.1 phage tail protein [Solihabitans fulvus]
MPISPAALLGMSMRFRVVVDEIDLGGWASCAGLAVEFHNQKIKQGANYEFQTIVPDCVDYPPITLQRAMNTDDSGRVQRWLSQVVSTWFSDSSDGGYSDRTAQITLLDSQNKPVTTWRLRNVYPQKWEGPDLDASTGRIALEKLQLVHEGFL